MDKCSSLTHRQQSNVLQDVYIHIYMHTYIHTYIHTYTHTYIHIYMHTCMHTCIHTYIYTYIHIVAFVYLYTLIIKRYLFLVIHSQLLTPNKKQTSEFHNVMMLMSLTIRHFDHTMWADILVHALTSDLNS